jgi:sugar phosphate permease
MGKVKVRSLWGTVFLLMVGYSGFYLCRSSFSVAKPLLLSTFSDLGKTKLGSIASVGTLLYALGKLVHGPLADRLGGKKMFLYGMAGAVFFSFVFGFGGPPFFLLAWAGNRFVQSAGWGGIIRIVSQWTTKNKYGTVMAFVSLSYLFGDFASRLLLGYWVRIGVGWQGLFTYSAAGLALIFLPILVLLREHPEPLIQFEGNSDTKSEFNSSSVFARPEFWIVCALSFCFTLLRETFNEWTPTYLNESAKLSKADAGQASSVFPLLGGVSVLVVGYLSDRATSSSPLLRLRVVPWGLAISGILLGVLGLMSDLSQTMIVAIVGAIAFFLIGPYSLLAGATSLDFGGSQKSATAAGWVDGVGYFGGILSGFGVGSLAQKMGWNVALNVLSIFCLVVASALAVVLNIQKQKLSNVLN